MSMKQLAVIIKHPYRDWDYRVDVYEVPIEITHEQIHKHVMSRMLGPFEVIAITEKLSIGKQLTAPTGKEDKK